MQEDARAVDLDRFLWQTMTTTVVVTSSGKTIDGESSGTIAISFVECS